MLTLMRVLICAGDKGSSLYQADCTGWFASCSSLPHDTLMLYACVVGKPEVNSFNSFTCNLQLKLLLSTAETMHL